MKKSIKLSIISNYIFRLFWVLSKRVPSFKNFFRLLRFISFHSDSMDLFGTALWHYYSNNLRSKFIFHQHCLQKKFNGYKYEVDLSRYFRNQHDLTSLERKLIDLSYGNILDIGSNTGYYMPFLMDKGTTTGIEISSKINSIAKKNGLHNCVTGDIFKYKFYKKFDTITLMENDIVLSGTLYRLKKLLKKFFRLLNMNGQVLLIIRNIRTLPYWRVVYTPHYNGCFGIPFKLFFLNVYVFKKLAERYNFQFNFIGKEGKPEPRFYLIRLVKSHK